MKPNPPGQRRLTWAQRSRWGRCPTCLREDGLPCREDVGELLVPLVIRKALRAVPPLAARHPVHLSRLAAAPQTVRVVGV